MSLRTAYERFLGHPNPLALAENATLSYVTTLKSFSGPGPISKHLQDQNHNEVRKKEKIISVVEGPSSIAVEVESTLQFISNGGAYLPGMDNFIVDHTAVLPVTHFVHFDRDQHISQIRMSWDQGSLLKQVEVIGVRGKNWPICEGPGQIQMITSSAVSAAAVAPVTPPRGRQTAGDRSASPNKKFVKDPHASLDLFSPKRAEEESTYAADHAPVAPRASARPPPREHSELFAAGHEDYEPSPGGSPSKKNRESVMAPKGAGGRKFANSGLFSEEQDYQEPKIYKTNPARYNHFDLGDSFDDPMQHRAHDEGPKKKVPLVARSDKHASQWDFQDFVTPAKLPQRVRAQDAVHFSFDNEPPSQGAGSPSQAGHPVKSRKDAETHFELQDDGTPVERHIQPKPRKDAQAHFDFTDEPTPAPRRNIIARTKAAQGLYANDQIYDESEEGGATPLAASTNNAGRNKNFASHWDLNDDSPASGRGNDENRPITGKVQSRKALVSHWEHGDEDNAPSARPATKQHHQQHRGHWDF